MRPNRVPTAVASLTLLLATLCSRAIAQGEQAAASPQRPNVVLIISDDQHWGDYGFMGSETIETPRLDQLAGESLVFRRGYVTTSLCCPSLAAMVTGLYPRHSGITGNLVKPLKEQQQVYVDFLKQSPSIPRLLGERGYLSLQTGKWWHGHWSNGGFTHGMSHGDVKRGGRHGDEGLIIGRKGLDPIPSFIDEAKAAEKPFFVWYAPFMPHTPHRPPARLFEKYKETTESPHIARYRAMCEWFDESCGQLLDFLEEKDVADNTVVLYVCDNGWINRPNAQRYAARSKRSPYDGGLRTPIMIRWPGRVSPGEAKGIAANIDLLPTVLEACGVAIPERADGLSLLQPANQDREAFTGAVYSHDAVDIRDASANLLHRWRIDGQWKLILPNPARLPERGPELYDILADPTEQKDLASKHPDVVDRLTKAIAEDW